MTTKNISGTINSSFSIGDDTSKIVRGVDGNLYIQDNRYTGADKLIPLNIGELINVDDSGVIGDYILQYDSNTNTWVAVDANNIQRIIIQSGGIDLANSPHQKINFNDTVFNITDGGAGVANLTIDDNIIYNAKYINGKPIVGTAADGEILSYDATNNQWTIINSDIHPRLHNLDDPLDHNPVSGSILDNIVTFNSNNGYPVKDSGYKISDLALYTDIYNNFVKDDTLSSGNHTSYLTKLSWVVTPVVSGSYHFKWSAELSATKSSQNVYILVDLDNSTIINEPAFASNSANVFVAAAGFDEVILLAGVTYTFRLKYKSSAASVTAKIRRCRMFIQHITS